MRAIIAVAVVLGLVTVGVAVGAQPCQPTCAPGAAVSADAGPGLETTPATSVLAVLVGLIGFALIGRLRGR